MRKKVLLLTVTFLLSFTMGTITAQTTKGQKSPVTTVMAKKIGFYCQYNQRALSLFAVANPQQVRNRTDLAHCYTLLQLWCRNGIFCSEGCRFHD